MCGIMGVISSKNIVPILVEGLKRLEYRGYDSTGLAVLDEQVRRWRCVGRMAGLEAMIAKSNPTSKIGIGHTRWASHGGVTEENAHPFISHEHLVIVHNGIIENYETLREDLRSLGYFFESTCDSEVIVHLIHYHTTKGHTLFEATRIAIKELHGVYSIAVMSLHTPGSIICAQMGCPMSIGLGENENFVSSDPSALPADAHHVIFLEEGDLAEVTQQSFRIVDASNTKVERIKHVCDPTSAEVHLGNYKHYMQKEIQEQPKVMAESIEEILETGFSPDLFGTNIPWLGDIDSVQILACGSSYYAGLVARQWIESYVGIPCAVEIASEYRYRKPCINPKQLIVTISQSGETIDTLEALKHAKSFGQERTLSICNVRGSAIPRASQLVYYTRAGKEIGVASTKAFSTQLIALFALMNTLAKLKGRLSPELEAQHLDALRHLPVYVQHALNLEPQIRVWADHFAPKEHALFLGRDVHYPIALEGALKLKEISYIHAEAYQAGELKHGPLALVDKNMPVVVIAPNDSLLKKLKSNMQEVRARGGKLFVVADLDSHFTDSEDVQIIRLMNHVGILSPIVHTIPMQLLALHTALQRGNDVDKPRNLAKSLTVE